MIFLQFCIRLDLGYTRSFSITIAAGLMSALYDMFGGCYLCGTSYVQNLTRKTSMCIHVILYLCFNHEITLFGYTVYWSLGR